MGSGPNHAEIARRAFDAVAAAQTVDSFEELDRVVAHELRAFGYDLVVGFRSDRRGGDQAVDVIFGDLQHRWVEHYNAHALGAHCPVARQTTFEPVLWSELRRRPYSAQEAMVFRDLDDFALLEGVSVAVDHARKGVVGVSVAGRDIDKDDPYVRAATHLLSVHFGLVGLKLWSATQAQAPSVSLSQRQIECLKWVRDGKSSVDIGEILGVSPRTVDEHVERACRRLGVKTRVQAVAEAALLGLLDL